MLVSQVQHPETDKADTLCGLEINTCNYDYCCYIVQASVMGKTTSRLRDLKQAGYERFMRAIEEVDESTVSLHPGFLSTRQARDRHLRSYLHFTRLYHKPPANANDDALMELGF